MIIPDEIAVRHESVAYHVAAKRSAGNSVNRIESIGASSPH